MGILIVLGVMVAVFAFTLGVHLGKKLGPGGHDGEEHAQTGETLPAATIDDAVPSRLEMSEQTKGTDQAISESLNQVLHDEVGKTGIKVEKPRALALPKETVSTNAGATHIDAKKEAPVEHADAEAIHASKSEHSESHEDPSEPPAQAKAAVHHKAPAHGEAEAKDDSTDLGRVKEALIVSRPAPHGKYTLQVGSFPSAKEALEHLEKLDTSGSDKAFVREAVVDGHGKRFRVFVGGFETKKDADGAAQKFVKDRLIQSYVVAKMPS